MNDPTEHLAAIEEAAQIMESAAKHNSEQCRTVMAHSQQGRADRLRRAHQHFSAPAPVVKVEKGRVWIVSGGRSFMLAYDAETDEERQWYANQLRGALAKGGA
jgi:hypothetical protein